MSKKVSALAFLLLSIYAVNLQSVSISASSSLSITVDTGKPCYQVGELVYVYGDLTYDGWPVAKKLVGIVVQNPDNDTIALSSRQTDDEGRYNLTFRLSGEAELGTYTVHVSSTVRDTYISNRTAFRVILLRLGFRRVSILTV